MSSQHWNVSASGQNGRGVADERVAGDDAASGHDTHGMVPAYPGVGQYGSFMPVPQHQAPVGALLLAMPGYQPWFGAFPSTTHVLPPGQGGAAGSAGGRQPGGGAGGGAYPEVGSVGGGVEDGTASGGHSHPNSRPGSAAPGVSRSGDPTAAARSPYGVVQQQQQQSDAVGAGGFGPGGMDGGVTAAQQASAAAAYRTGFPVPERPGGAFAAGRAAGYQQRWGSDAGGAPSAGGGFYGSAGGDDQRGPAGYDRWGGGGADFGRGGRGGAPASGGYPDPYGSPYGGRSGPAPGLGPYGAPLAGYGDRPGTRGRAFGDPRTAPPSAMGPGGSPPGMRAPGRWTGGAVGGGADPSGMMPPGVGGMGPGRAGGGFDDGGRPPRDQFGGGSLGHGGSPYGGGMEGGRGPSRSLLAPEPLVLKAKDIRGKVVLMARDQGGGRLLQARLESRDQEVVDVVYSEVVPHLYSIANDPFGNYLFQKLLVVVSPERRSAALRVFLGIESPERALAADAAGDWSSIIAGEAAFEALRNLIKNAETAAQSGEPPLDPTGGRGGMGMHRGFEPLEDAHWTPWTKAGIQLHGTRVVQKFIELCSSVEEDEQLMFLALHERGGIKRMACDANGNHVVARCLHQLPEAHRDWVSSVVVDNLVAIACHRHGCVVVQRAFDVSRGDLRSRLLSIMTENALVLIQDPFANYCVQYVLTNGAPEETRTICRQVCGHLFVLACGKFSSNVIELCMQQGDEEIRSMLLDELCGIVPTRPLHSRSGGNGGTGSDTPVGERDPGADATGGAPSGLPTGTDVIGRLVCDPFGNYVVQRAIMLATQGQRDMLLAALQPHFGLLATTPGGRRVASRLLSKYPELADVLPPSSVPHALEARGHDGMPGPYMGGDFRGRRGPGGGGGGFRGGPGGPGGGGGGFGFGRMGGPGGRLGPGGRGGRYEGGGGGYGMEPGMGGGGGYYGGGGGGRGFGGRGGGGGFDQGYGGGGGYGRSSYDPYGASSFPDMPQPGEGYHDGSRRGSNA